MARVARLAQLVVVAFWFAASAYAFLSSVPFAYEQFIAPRLVPGLVEFAEWHKWIAVLALPLTWLAVQARLVDSRARQAARATLGLSAAAAVLLPFAPSLATLGPTPWAVAASMLSLLVPVSFAVTDLMSAPAWPDDPPQDHTAGDFVAALGAGLVVTGIYGARGLALGHQDVGAGVGVSLLVHAVFVAAAFLLLAVIRGTAAASGHRAPAREFWLTALALAGVFALLLLGVILPSLSVSGRARTVAAATLALVLTLVLAARGRHRRAPTSDGVQTALACFVPGVMHGRGRAIATVAWLVLTGAVAVGFATASGVMDWSFVLARIGAYLTWLLALSGALALPRGAVRKPAAGFAFAGCLALLVTHQFVAPPPGLAAESPVDRYAVVDPSFRMLREALRPPVPSDPNFYPFLQRNTNLGRDLDVKPVDVSLAKLEGAPSARRPNIFLFVIDSLRRDYVSPYNDKVTFTPEIGKFAAENIAFQKVFTRYGATGLSVPSIWVGGMILHKQYVQPFAPMNSLHKLLAHEDYTRWMSWDNVVDAITPHEHEGPALDTTRAVKDLRFCETAAEITGRLDELKPGGPPVFAWALSQDIHISAITREGAAPIDQGDYGSFYKPYASRMKRIDSCFGQFIQALKTRGLYDDSVVILTADHGDSLGEEGRWGHAYTLFPEILQVPLVMHLPKWFLADHDTDPDALAFTTDITPTLYALFGHQPSPPAPVFGQPLFWAKGQQPPTRPGDGHLVASSYGSVYGWLTGEGRALYVADGVDFRDYQFALDGSPTGQARSVGNADRQAGQQAIHEAVEGIAKFYKFQAP